LDLPLAELSDYELTMDGEPFFGQISGCNFDTLYTYSYSLLAGQGNSGPYTLDNWTVNGQDYSFEFQDVDDLVAAMNVIDPNGAWIHNESSLLIAGGVPNSNYTMINATQIQNQLPAIIGLSYGLEPMGTQLGVEVGEYEIILQNIENGCADTMQVIVLCYVSTPTDTIINTISADENPYVVCLDTTNLPGNIVSISNVCPDNSNGFVNFLIDEDEFCVKYQGLKCNGEAEACIIICDDLGLCDTTIFQITVDNTLCDLEAENYDDEMLINFSETYCVDTTELPGMVVNMENVCEDASIGNVDFDFDLDNLCVTYTGVNVGNDVACIVLTDQYGNMDTTFFNIIVVLPQPETIVDTIFYGENTTFCIEITELAGNTFTIFNDCEDLSGDTVTFGINDVILCVEASGIGLGTESACIIICDEFGICDSTNWIVTVADNGDPCAQNPPPTTIDDTTETPSNTPTNISILDNDNIPDCSPAGFVILDAAANGIAVANIDGTTVDYLPNTDFCGADEFTYVVCNDHGCDTASVVVSVECVPASEVKIYNAFTPNGDGMSDFFTIVNIENFPNNELRVYNRWGNEVFQDLSYNNTWDGTYNESMLPDGTYFYKLSIEGKKDVAGYVQIAR
jgi:gliding motility-associated-like protein